MWIQHLYAEVRVNVAKVKTAETSSSTSFDEVRALTTIDFQHVIQDLNSQIDKLQWNDGTGNGNGNKNG